MNERTAFEAWASDHGSWPQAIERNGDGYKLAQTHSAWRVWQARAACEADALSFRDIAALNAMQGLCANPGGPFQENGRSGWGLVNCTLDDVATTAYAHRSTPCTTP